jgi:LysR family transcriptional regulator, hca operon transcriptional activator
MELRHLRYFIAVAEHLNFSRAAEELQTAQPSLSQQIRSLEDELKMKLFERTHRYVALTAEGALLLPEARAIVQRVDALTTFRSPSAVPQGPLRIASITASTIAVLPRVLPSYRAAYPDVSLSIETGTLEDDTRALIERRVDVAFLRAPLNDARLEAALAAEEQFGVALPAAHPLSSRKRIPFRALDGLDIVGMRNEFTGGFNAAVADLFRKHNVTAGAKVQTGSVETMLGMVASGMGIAMVSSVVKFMLVSGVVLLPLEPGPMFKSLYVAWRRDRADVPVIRSFREHVINAGLRFPVAD